MKTPLPVTKLPIVPEFPPSMPGTCYEFTWVTKKESDVPSKTIDNNDLLKYWCFPERVFVDFYILYELSLFAMVGVPELQFNYWEYSFEGVGL